MFGNIGCPRIVPGIFRKLLQDCWREISTFMCFFESLRDRFIRFDIDPTAAVVNCQPESTTTSPQFRWQCKATAAVNDTLIREIGAMIVDKLIACLPDRFQLLLLLSSFELEDGDECRLRTERHAESVEKMREHVSRNTQANALAPCISMAPSVRPCEILRIPGNDTKTADSAAWRDHDPASRVLRRHRTVSLPA